MQKYKIPLVVIGILIIEYIAVLVLKSVKPSDDENVIIAALFFFIFIGAIAGFILHKTTHVVLAILLCAILATGLAIVFKPPGKNAPMAIAMVLLSHLFIMPAGGKLGISIRGMIDGPPK